jgi:hypothetical protein
MSLIAINSRKHFTKIFKLVKLDVELSCHACQFKLQNVSKIIYQDLSGSKFATVFLAISRISAGDIGTMADKFQKIVKKTRFIRP